MAGTPGRGDLTVGLGELGRELIDRAHRGLQVLRDAPLQSIKL